METCRLALVRKSPLTPRHADIAALFPHAHHDDAHEEFTRGPPEKLFVLGAIGGHQRAVVTMLLMARHVQEGSTHSFMNNACSLCTWKSACGTLSHQTTHAAQTPTGMWKHSHRALCFPKEETTRFQMLGLSPSITTLFRIHHVGTLDFSGT